MIYKALENIRRTNEKQFQRFSKVLGTLYWQLGTIMEAEDTW